MMHGSIYAYMKTEGEYQQRVGSWIPRTIVFFVICYVLLTATTLLYVPHLAESLRAKPIYLGLGVLTMLAVANIPREVHRGREWRAFLSSSCAIAGLLFLFGLGFYPNIVIAEGTPEHTLDIYNAASSAKTHQIMLIIAAIGIPFVLAYHFSIYWIFRGKVKLDSLSY
jgi:cytochrome d ubiquinol oxidase subunit II